MTFFTLNSILYEPTNEFVVTALTPTTITNCVSGIEPLNGTKFSSWKEQVKISLGITDLDYALRFDKPNPLTVTSMVDEKRTYEIWERSNRMSLMIMKNSISIAIRGAIPDTENDKEFLKSVEEQFKGSSKANVSTLILKMLTTKYDDLSGVRKHIMMMNDMASKLKGMDMVISECFLVHFIMTSIPSHFGPFKINYNTQKEKWKISELIAMCVQEEEMLKIKKPDIAYLTTTKGHKKKFFKGNKGSKWEKGNSDKASSKKSKSLNVFKIFKAEVENQLNCKTKIVRSDRGREYYGKHSDLGQSPGLFALYCQENGIVNQFTMPYTPQQNGVAERQNRTLMDMMRSMICNSILLEFLWIEALKTATHILNSVPSKSVLKTSFELWTGRAPSLRYFKIWGCPAEAKIFNPQTKKRDSRTISCYFIGYPERSKGGERSIDLNEKLIDAPTQDSSIPLYMENTTIVPSDDIFDILVVDAPPHDENPIPPIVQQPLQRPERTRRPVVHDDFITDVLSCRVNYLIIKF
ncbi:retrovirus-related pol polyprotein from transposon TNT 1-94 [Tanacetum coccineum]